VNLAEIRKDSLDKIHGIRALGMPRPLDSVPRRRNGLRLGADARPGRQAGARGRIQLQPKRIVHRPQFQIHQRIVEIGNAASVELVAEPVPGLLGGGAQLAPVEKDVALVGVQIDGEAALGQIARRGAGIRGR
jgi:hypothetical protein